jgi:hypothetical protein
MKFGTKLCIFPGNGNLIKQTNENPFYPQMVANVTQIHTNEIVFYPLIAQIITNSFAQCSMPHAHGSRFQVPDSRFQPQSEIWNLKYEI